MDRRGDEAMTQRIHFQERCETCAVTIVIPVMSLRERRTGKRLHGDDPEVGMFTMEFIHKEGETCSGKVTSSADAACDDIWVLV